MIIDDLNVKCIRTAPTETDPPLIVNANTVLTTPFSLESLQTIPRRGSKITQFRCAVQLAQFPASYLLERNETRDTLSAIELFGVPTTERPDHPHIV